MDDRTQVIDRLRALELDGGSHENLSAIARAILPDATFGWTVGACGRLRDTLVALIGGENEVYRQGWHDGYAEGRKDDCAEPLHGITDELRGLARGFKCVWMESTDGTITYTIADVQPTIESVSLEDYVLDIADRIDAEHQKAEDEWKVKDGQSWIRGYGECHAELMEGNEAIAADLEKAGWVRLPVDADGVPWHLGDVTESGNTITAMGFNRHGWYFTGVPNDIDPSVHRHYHAQTVEDVLREFAERVCNSGHQWGLDANATIAEYAERLRLAGEGE